MEKGIRFNISCIIFVLFIISSLSSFAQVDNLHYIPPMCSFTGSVGNVQDHRMVLTTSETTAFDVTIKNNDGTFVMTVKGLSSSSPKKVDLNFSEYFSNSNKTSGTGLNSQGVIGTSELNKILNKEGLIVSGSKKFFVSIQQKSTAQGDLLTSKGTTGLGTDFFSGHMYSSTGGYDEENGHFISVMATENNTNITISNPRVHLKNQPNTFTISLNKGESYVVGISITDLKKQTSNLNEVNGTHITSNKPIAVSSGSWCASGFPNNSPGRDIGFDQLVPTDVVGDEYILIKGEGQSGGAQYNEKALIVATEDDTKIYLNGSSTVETTLDEGEYFFTDYTDFGTNKNLYIRSDKKVFCYQTLSGANKKQTAGFCFIPPLKCTADKEVTIAFANKLSSLSVDPILKLITQTGSQIKLNGVNLQNVSSYKKSVPGNIYWETYNIPKSELQRNRYNYGTNWIFKISSTGALNAMLAVQSGNVGGGGFFSGFGDVPQIEQNPEIESEGLCGDNVILTADGFDSYNWYKDGVLISDEHNATYEPSNPGRYKVTGLSPCGGSSTESFPSSEIIIYPCLSVSDVSVTEGTDLNAVVRVELSHTWSTDDEVDVTFEYELISGTGTGAKDYKLRTESGKVTIPSGKKYVNILIPIIDDSLNEDDEDFTLKISNVVEAVENVTDATVTIIDDNDPMPTITVTDQTYDEDAGTVSLTVSLNTESGKTITADYSISDNTTTQESDYTAINYSGSLSFVPGDQEETISFSIENDAIYEPGADEYFTLSLSNLVNTSEGDISADISITDNDSKPEITTSDVGKKEGESITFIANIDHAADVDITFTYQIVLGTSISDAEEDDFENYSTFSLGTITIPAGDTSVDFPSFVTKDDNANEQAEVFTVNFSSASYSTFANSSAIGTIIDNEGDPTLSIADASATEGGTLLFSISVSPINSSDIVFQYRTIDGTATSSDFKEADWTSITLPANSSSMILSIATDQDTEEEGTETFTVEIGNQPSGVLLAANPETATGTILDDDDTPIAKNDTYLVDEDKILTGNVMSNDSGLSDTPIETSIKTSPTNGSLSMNTDGSFTYTPTANFNGADSFTYTIQDLDGDTSWATVNITVNSVNDVPIATNDIYTIDEDTQLKGNVSSNDTNLFDLPITISLVSDVSDGALTLNADGTFSYLPDSEYFGTDYFTYQLTDGNGDAVQAVVTINVTFINDAAPVAVDDNTSTNEDTAVTIDVLANDTDVDGNETIDVFSVLIKTSPSHGSLSQDFTTGTVTYTPNSNYTGSDSFTYTIKDDSGSESNVATVSINVTVDNDLPVASCKSDVIIYLDGTGNYTLDPSEIDDDSYDIEDGSNVTLSVSPNTFDCDDKGSNSITLTVTDTDNASSTCTTTVSVVDNLPPSITAKENISVSSSSGICGAIVNYTGPIFTDNCDGVQSGNLIYGRASGSTFPIGTTTITYEYTDVAGNETVQSSFTVTVTDDQDPVFSNTNDRNLSPNSSGCEYLVSGTSFDLTATDNCSITSLSHDYDGGGSTLDGKSFSLGITDVTWTAEDIHNNIISTVVQVTVSTDLSVSLTGPSSDQSCEGEDVIFTASASGGNPGYSYQFFVNNTEQTDGVTGSTFTTSTLVDGDKVTTRITDQYGCSVTSSEIEMIIHPKPAPTGIFFED